MTDTTAKDKPARKLAQLHMIDGRSKTSPPCTLGEAGQDLWNRIVSSYDFSDAGGVELLAQICQAADRAANLRRQIDETGELIHTRAGLKDNPGLKHEIAARSFIARSLIRLGLNCEPLRAGPGRPGTGGLGIGSR